VARPKVDHVIQNEQTLPLSDQPKDASLVQYTHLIRSRALKRTESAFFVPLWPAIRPIR